jgi:hypothetical protein
MIIFNRISIIVFLCSLANITFSQAILTSSNMNLNVGDQFVYKFDTVLVTANGGANQNWDFSSVQPNFSAVFSVSAANGNVFPSANVVLNSSSFGTNSYYSTSPISSSIVGKTSNAIDFVYNDPQIILKFPFQLGNNFIDTWSCPFNNGTSNFYRKGIDSVIADGSGTLKTILANYTDILRVKAITNYSDSLIGITNFINYNATEYNYYKNGFHQPIAMVKEQFTNGILSNKSSFYLDLIVQNIFDQQEELFATLSIAPNPSRDFIQLQFKSAVPENLEILFSDATGKSVPFTKDVIDEATLKLHPNKIIAGNYYISLFLDGQKIGGKTVQFF